MIGEDFVFVSYWPRWTFAKSWGQDYAQKAALFESAFFFKVLAQSWKKESFFEYKNRVTYKLLEKVRTKTSRDKV